MKLLRIVLAAVLSSGLAGGYKMMTRAPSSPASGCEQAAPVAAPPASSGIFQQAWHKVAQLVGGSGNGCTAAEPAASPPLDPGGPVTVCKGTRGCSKV